jgi:hypothetical protein
LELFVTRGPRSGWKLISVSKERNIEPRNKATDADTPKQQEKMGLHHHKKHNNSKEHYCPSVAAFFVTIVKRAS